MSSDAPPPSEPPADPSAPPAPYEKPSLSVRTPETTAGATPAGPAATDPPAAAPPPAPDPSKQACSNCSAQNAQSAEFCWQCHARLIGGGAAQAGAAADGRPGAPGPSTSPAYTGPALAAQQHHPGPGGTTSSVGNYEDRQKRIDPIDYTLPLPASKRDNPLLSVARMLIPVLAIVGAVYLGLKLFGSGISIPAEINGLPRIESQQAADVLDRIESSLESSGLEADLAYFGNNGQPSMYLVVLKGSDSPPAEELFNQLAALGGQASVGTPARREFNGATYLCAPAEGVIQAACLWQQGDIVGLVASYDQEVQPTFEFTVAAHDAIHGN